MPNPSDHNRPARGRPSGTMTHRRQQVLEQITASVLAGEGMPTLASIARRCGLYSFRDAKRVRDDLKRMGRI